MLGGGGRASFYPRSKFVLLSNFYAADSSSSEMKLCMFRMYHLYLVRFASRKHLRKSVVNGKGGGRREGGWGVVRRGEKRHSYRTEAPRI